MYRATASSDKYYFSHLLSSMNHRFHHILITKKTITSTILGIILFIGSLSIILAAMNNNNINQLASAQTPATNDTSSSNLDTFNARGTISSLAADIITGTNATLGGHPEDIWVLGGNWSYGVMNGNLSDFNLNIIMTQLTGSGLHTHSIANLRNVTGEVQPLTNTTSIMLRNSNYTDFVGIADINTNDQVKWKDVPIAVHMLRGNIVNINTDPIKTEDHFKGLPVFGTVTSITDQNNNELRTGQPPM
jgi:hypothetical protein